MFQQIFVRAMAFLALVASLTACAGPSIGPMPRSIAPGYVYALTGRYGDDNFYRPLLYRIPARCAGRTIELQAWYRTEGITAGVRTYHGIHFDYEVFATGGAPVYPPDWRAEPSYEWQPINRTWNIPADMRSGHVRIGLQGVSGVLYVRDIQVTGC
ncbi:MAG: hypothetical protein E6R05_05060 [Candidatus Moraniibacteriota bacterium]|nr:MAG: hypothetical protein E6R05_05060 [Candidatus Moranbacteria bacterium]